MAKTQGKGGFRVVGGVFTTIGLVTLGIGGWFGNRQYTILKSWPTVEAVVTKSQVAHYRGMGRHGGTSMTYQAEVEFRYTLNGKEFVTPATSGYGRSDYAATKREADAFVRGTRHTIRYNPADPNDIRMNARYSLGFFLVPLIMGVIGLPFAGVGVALLIASRWAQALQCPACGQPVDASERFCSNCAAPLQISAPQ